MNNSYTTYSTRVIIPLSVFEKTAANGVTPSLSATSTEEGERSERKTRLLLWRSCQNNFEILGIDNFEELQEIS